MKAETTNGQSAHSWSALPDGEATNKYRGQRTMDVTEVFSVTAFVDSRRVGVVLSPDEI